MLPPWARDTFPLSWIIKIAEFVAFFVGPGYIETEWSSRPPTKKYLARQQLSLRHELWIYLSTETSFRALLPKNGEHLVMTSTIPMLHTCLDFDEQLKVTSVITHAPATISTAYVLVFTILGVTIEKSLITDLEEVQKKVKYYLDQISACARAERSAPISV